MHEKDSSSKHLHKWDENTAATWPTFKFNDGAKSINIEESLTLQLKADEKIKVLSFIYLTELAFMIPTNLFTLLVDRSH